MSHFLLDKILENIKNNKPTNVFNLSSQWIIFKLYRFFVAWYLVLGNGKFFKDTNKLNNNDTIRNCG